MRVGITGSHGLIGSALVAALEARGDEVVRLGRTGAPDLSGVDAVVNLAGASIAGRPWTRAYKREILRSRVECTRGLVRALAREAERGRRLAFLSGSAVGFYGSQGRRELTESAAPGDDFLAMVAREWEAAAAPAADAGHRVVNLRTGLVLAPAGGFLAPQRPVFRAGLGGVVGSGENVLPWITVRDYVRAVLFLLDEPDASGPVNMTAPGPVTQREFGRTYARVLGRPAAMRVPAWAVRVALGGDMAESMVLASQNAVPVALREWGFEHRDVELGAALRGIESEA